MKLVVLFDSIGESPVCHSWVDTKSKFDWIAIIQLHSLACVNIWKTEYFIQNLVSVWVSDFRVCLCACMNTNANANVSVCVFAWRACLRIASRVCYCQIWSAIQWSFSTTQHTHVCHLQIFTLIQEAETWFCHLNIEIHWQAIYWACQWILQVKDLKIAIGKILTKWTTRKTPYLVDTNSLSRPVASILLYCFRDFLYCKPLIELTLVFFEVFVWLCFKSSFEQVHLLGQSGINVQ